MDPPDVGPLAELLGEFLLFPPAQEGRQRDQADRQSDGEQARHDTNSRSSAGREEAGGNQARHQPRNEPGPETLREELPSILALLLRGPLDLSTLLKPVEDPDAQRIEHQHREEQDLGQLAVVDERPESQASENRQHDDSPEASPEGLLATILHTSVGRVLVRRLLAAMPEPAQEPVAHAESHDRKHELQDDSQRGVQHRTHREPHHVGQTENGDQQTERFPTRPVVLPDLSDLHARTRKRPDPPEQPVGDRKTHHHDRQPGHVTLNREQDQARHTDHRSDRNQPRTGSVRIPGMIKDPVDRIPDQFKDVDLLLHGLRDHFQPPVNETELPRSKNLIDFYCKANLPNQGTSTLKKIRLITERTPNTNESLHLA